MSYIKRKVTDGDTVIDKKLIDHIQDGIVANDKVLDAAKGEYDSLPERLAMMEIKSTVTLECDVTHMTVISENPAVINYRFRSTMSGSGTATYFVNNVQRKVERIQQGDVSTDISNYLKIGTNEIKIQVKDSVGTINLIELTIECVEVKIESSFESSKVYTGNISFVYKCFGIGLNKTVHMFLDGEPLTTDDVGINVGLSHNQNIEYIIRNITGHGSHIFEIYYTTDEGYKSNTLTYDIMFSTGDPTPIISSILGKHQISYGDSLPIKYAVYTSGKETTDVVERRVYGFTYEICSPETEGSLVIIDNDSEFVGDDEIKLQDLKSLPNYDEFQVGDVIIGTKYVFASSTLSDVPNQKEDTWVIQDYPSSGYIGVEIKATSTTNDIEYNTMKEFSVYINDSGINYELEAVTTRLVLALNAANRTNSDANRSIWNYDYTSKDDITTTIEADLQDFNYSSNGWVMDSESSPVLRHSGIAKTTIKVPIFSSGYTDKNDNVINFSGLPQTKNSGRTIEIEFNVHDVTDDNTEIIKCYDEETDIGFVITPSYAYLLSSTSSITYDENGNVDNKDTIPFVTIKDGERVKLSMVIEPIGFFVDSDTGMNKQMVRMYINGELCAARPYSDSTSFNQSSYIEIGSDKCITDIYSVRLYDDALADHQILQNYVADKDNINTKISIYKDNDVLDALGNVSYELCRKKYPCILVTGKLSGFKGDKTKIGIIYTKPDETENDGYVTELNLMDQIGDKYLCQSNVQGTSSQRYAKKNYKFSFKKNVNGEATKVKYKLKGDQSIGEDTLCYKIDYMSPNHANTANANLLSSFFDEPVPPQEEDEKVQITIYGYRCLLFQRDTVDSTIYFHGDGCLNNDKGNTKTFGLENDEDDGNQTKCQKWEFLDNSQDICNFRTDKLMKKMNGEYAVLSSLESSYPDQGDLEDAGLLPDYSHIQILYTWVCQRANFLHASKDSSGFIPVTYNGVTYTNEYDYKKAIFKNEFELHFNLNHVLTYYLAVEYVALVDNRAKNMFLTCYDVTKDDIKFFNYNYTEVTDIIDPTTGNVDVNAIDWERSTFAIWYTSLYDMDSCLGLENSGYNLVPYYAEWDYKHKGQYIFNGADSEFWLMVEDAFADEIKGKYNKCRTENRTLTYSNFYKKHVTDNADLVCPTIVNQDARFKYIDIWTEGYAKFQEDNVTQTFEKTSDYMYLVRGGMKHHNTEFMRNRDEMLASKYKASDFLNDKIELRIGHDPGDSSKDISRDMQVTVTPASALYCFASWGNSDLVYYDEGSQAKTMAGDTCTMYPQSGSSFRDILLSISGASYLSSVGDLSHLIPYSINISKATKLQELKVGDNADGYTNYRLQTLDVASNILLKKLNVQNCTSLTGSLNLTQNNILEEVYAEGSGLSSIDFPVGGYLKKIHMPAVDNVTIRDHKYIEEFTIDSFDNIKRLWVENDINNKIPVVDILKARRKNILRLRLVGINWNLGDDKDEILQLLIDDSMSNKQINMNGEEVDGYPIITGSIYVNYTDPSTLARLKSLYPNLSITYREIRYRANFRNSDGTILYYTNLEKGVTPADPYAEGLIPVPTMSPDMNPDNEHRISVKIIDPDTNKIKSIEYVPEQYDFTFHGWDNPLSPVPDVTEYYAVYDITDKTYTVKFYNEKGSKTPLLTHTNVAYGASIPTPTIVPVSSNTSSDSTKGYKFIKWVDENGSDVNYKFIKSDLNIYGYYELVSIREIPTSHDYLVFTPVYDDSSTILSYTVKQNEDNKPSGLLVIPLNYGDYKVTAIDSYAFSGNNKITEVIFLDGNDIIEIGDYAFNECIQLTHINIEKTSITKIDCCTFNLCKLDSINIPNTVMRIETSAFYGALKSTSDLFIPSSVIFIGSIAFGENTFSNISYGMLKSGIDPDNISVGASAFKGSTINKFNMYQNRLIDSSVDNSTYNLPGAPWDATITSLVNIQALATVTVNFVNFDPELDELDRPILFSTKVIAGGSVSEPVANGDISTPEYTDKIYVYTFTGWNTSLDSMGDINSDNDIICWVAATYSTVLRKYKVNFYNGIELMATQEVEYGSKPVMDFDIPPYADKYFGELDYIDMSNDNIDTYLSDQRVWRSNIQVLLSGPRVEVLPTFKMNYSTEIKIRPYATCYLSLFGTSGNQNYYKSLSDYLYIQNGIIHCCYRHTQKNDANGYEGDIGYISGACASDKVKTPLIDIYNTDAIIRIDSNGTIDINGVNVITHSGIDKESTLINTCDVSLFATNTSYGAQKSGYGYYFYYFKIWADDRIIRDIVPVYSNGEVIFLNRAYNKDDPETGKSMYTFNYEKLLPEVTNIYDIVKLPDNIKNTVNDKQYVFSGWNDYNKDVEPVTADIDYYAFYEPINRDINLDMIEYDFYDNDLSDGVVGADGNTIESDTYICTPDFMSFNSNKIRLNIHEDYSVLLYEFAKVEDTYVLNSSKSYTSSDYVVVSPSSYYKLSIYRKDSNTPRYKVPQTEPIINIKTASYYVKPLEEYSWDEIISIVSNEGSIDEDGRWCVTRYNEVLEHDEEIPLLAVGDTKTVKLLNGETITLRIEAFNAYNDIYGDIVPLTLGITTATNSRYTKNEAVAALNVGGEIYNLLPLRLRNILSLKNKNGIEYISLYRSDELVGDNRYPYYSLKDSIVRTNMDGVNTEYLLYDDKYVDTTGTIVDITDDNPSKSIAYNIGLNDGMSRNLIFESSKSYSSQTEMELSPQQLLSKPFTHIYNLSITGFIGTSEIIDMRYGNTNEWGYHIHLNNGKLFFNDSQIDEDITDITTTDILTIVVRCDHFNDIYNDMIILLKNNIEVCRFSNIIFTNNNIEYTNRSMIGNPMVSVKKIWLFNNRYSEEMISKYFEDSLIFNADNRHCPYLTMFDVTKYAGSESDFLNDSTVDKNKMYLISTVDSSEKKYVLEYICGNWKRVKFEENHCLNLDNRNSIYPTEMGTNSYIIGDFASGTLNPKNYNLFQLRGALTNNPVYINIFSGGYLYPRVTDWKMIIKIINTNNVIESGSGSYIDYYANGKTVPLIQLGGQLSNTVLTNTYYGSSGCIFKVKAFNTDIIDDGLGDYSYTAKVTFQSSSALSSSLYSGDLTWAEGSELHTFLNTTIYETFSVEPDLQANILPVKVDGVGTKIWVNTAQLAKGKIYFGFCVGIGKKSMVPQYPIPLEDCSWELIDVIGKLGYQKDPDDNGPWGINRLNYDTGEVEFQEWFNIGDKKTMHNDSYYKPEMEDTVGSTIGYREVISPTNYEVKIYDFNHDYDVDGNLVPFFFGSDKMLYGSRKYWHNYDSLESNIVFYENTNNVVTKQRLKITNGDHTCMTSSYTTNSTSTSIYGSTNYANSILYFSYIEVTDSDGNIKVRWYFDNTDISALEYEAYNINDLLCNTSKTYTTTLSDVSMHIDASAMIKYPHHVCLANVFYYEYDGSEYKPIKAPFTNYDSLYYNGAFDASGGMGALFPGAKININTATGDMINVHLYSHHFITPGMMTEFLIHENSVYSLEDELKKHVKLTVHPISISCNAATDSNVSSEQITYNNYRSYVRELAYDEIGKLPIPYVYSCLLTEFSGNRLPETTSNLLFTGSGVGVRGANGSPYTLAWMAGIYGTRIYFSV